MKSILSSLFAGLILVSATSCGKNFKADADLTYVAEDYRNSTYDIMGLDLTEVESIIMYFYTDKKLVDEKLKYKLVLIHIDEYKSKDYWLEFGSYEVNDKDITFWPEGDETPIRYGIFQNEKKNFLLFDGNAHQPEGINFVLKRK